LPESPGPPPNTRLLLEQTMRHRASSVTVVAAGDVVASVVLFASLVCAASTAKHTAAHTNSIVVSVGHGGVMQQLQQHTTVREAVEAVRALPMQERAKGVTVTLAGGDYLGPDNQLALDARDSGIAGAPVVWVLHHTPAHSVTHNHCMKPLGPRQQSASCRECTHC